MIVPARHMRMLSLKLTTLVTSMRALLDMEGEYIAHTQPHVAAGGFSVCNRYISLPCGFGLGDEDGNGPPSDASHCRYLSTFESRSTNFWIHRPMMPRALRSPLQVDGEEHGLENGWSPSDW